MMKFVIVAGSALLFLMPQTAGAVQSVTTSTPAGNAEMAAIFQADQADRAPGGAAIDWAVVTPHDEVRIARTRALLNAGALRTGDDYYHAAFIFQHGTTPNDYLMAHALAVAAAARGHADAPWIAAASLDRYLMNIGQPQIYGTQFNTPLGRNTTQEPYNRSLVPDALRQALGVRTQAEQELRRSEIEASFRNHARPRP
jgi:hypothetical protein